MGIDWIVFEQERTFCFGFSYQEAKLEDHNYLWETQYLEYN